MQCLQSFSTSALLERIFATFALLLLCYACVLQKSTGVKAILVSTGDSVATTLLTTRVHVPLVSREQVVKEVSDLDFLNYIFFIVKANH